MATQVPDDKCSNGDEYQTSTADSDVRSCLGRIGRGCGGRHVCSCLGHGRSSHDSSSPSTQLLKPRTNNGP